MTEIHYGTESHFIFIWSISQCLDQRYRYPITGCLYRVWLFYRCPAFMLDIRFTFNIALALLVLLVAIYTRQLPDFAVFQRY